MATTRTSAYVVTCRPCGLRGRQGTSPQNARQLAATHDRIHHKGRPTATVRPA